MRPVHEAPEVVPLVQAAHVDAIPESHGDALGEFGVMGDQQRPTVADIDDEPLVIGAISIITQKAADEARDFDPPPVVAFIEANSSWPSQAPS